MDLTVRPALLSDASTLVRLNQALAQEARGERLEPTALAVGVQSVLDDPGRGFYTVVEIQNQVVAAALITFEWSDWRNAWNWWLQDVYVEPDQRRKGVFRTLYNHLRTRAKAQGVNSLKLYVYKGNIRAQEVYRQLGMVASQSDLFEEKL